MDVGERHVNKIGHEFDFGNEDYLVLVCHLNIEVVVFLKHIAISLHSSVESSSLPLESGWGFVMILTNRMWQIWCYAHGSFRKCYTSFLETLVLVFVGTFSKNPPGTHLELNNLYL